MADPLHKFWLKVAAVIVASFGPVFFLGTMEWSAEPARWTLDLLSWPLDGEQRYTHSTTRFLSALTGGFLLGWGVMIWMLSGNIYDAAPESVRRCVVGGFIAWFLLDSAGSVASGNAPNVLFNIVIIMIAVGPLWLPAKT